MKASAYLQLPEKLKNSKYILNIQNEDDKCAQWCIIAHLFPKYENNRTRRLRNINAYRHHEKDINTTGIQFPLKIIYLKYFIQKSMKRENIKLILQKKLNTIFIGQIDF